MLSTLEIRHLVEQSFLPSRCECTSESGDSLTIRFFQDNSNQEILVVTGVAVAQLANGHAIANLVTGLRQDLELVILSPGLTVNHQVFKQRR
ncbi:DUF1652 domain-containing protein [Pseudomonas sp. PLMAX]|uniref:DUF1652 domain-containing protein n=1 Tax=Pseudomonas sp. PLMAX TaxID=2201998 RepID=UPI0038B86391